VIIFRCDAGPQIGFGHLNRCRVLAKKLIEKGETVCLMGPDSAYAERQDATIFEDWIEVAEWPSAVSDAEYLLQIATKKNALWLVCDDYRVDEAYQRLIYKSSLNFAYFKGQHDILVWADVVIHTSPAANRKDYKGLLRNPATKLLLGPAYAILRPEFINLPLRTIRNKIRNVFVNFGAGNDRGAIRFVIETLLPVTPEEMHFTVVSGRANPNNPELATWFSESGKGRVKLQVSPANMATVMMECDLAVMAGGTTTCEAARCGLPMLLMAIATNQIPQSKAWNQLGAARYLGMFPGVNREKMVRFINEELINKKPRTEMSKFGTDSVDAFGANRIIDVLSS
jgi:UDP-2,4-diacetamido-2,4,6-trideoxy-beta-L-altropyranose hydrolase